MSFLVKVERPDVGEFLFTMQSMNIVDVVPVQNEKKKLKPNGDARTHSPDRKPPGTFKESGEKAILALLYKRPMPSSAIATAFEKQGRSPKSIASCLHKLKTGKLIVGTDDGYTLTKIARDRQYRQNNKGKK